MGTEVKCRAAKKCVGNFKIASLTYFWAYPMQILALCKKTIIGMMYSMQAWNSTQVLTVNSNRYHTISELCQKHLKLCAEYSEPLAHWDLGYLDLKRGPPYKDILTHMSCTLYWQSVYYSDFRAVVLGKFCQKENLSPDSECFWHKSEPTWRMA